MTAVRYAFLVYTCTKKPRVSESILSLLSSAEREFNGA